MLMKQLAVLSETPRGMPRGAIDIAINIPPPRDFIHHLGSNMGSNN
eukprot:SAG31_NODE_1190_length_9465_cov_4.082746_7_plen_46_part_00